MAKQMRPSKQAPESYTKSVDMRDETTMYWGTTAMIIVRPDHVPFTNQGDLAA